MIKLIKTVTSVLMLIVMTVSLVGCASEAVRADDLMVGIERSLYAPTPQPEEYGEKLTDFAVKLFKSCIASDGKQNVIISPLSLLLAVSMTAEGAEGETLSQIENAFGLSLDEIRKYSLYLLSQNRNLTNKNLKIANSIWFRKDESFEVNSDFLQTNVDYYDASVYSAPFNNSTVDEINKWVDQKTDHMIPSIVDSIDPEDVMFLINSLAFDADWARKYDANNTSEGDFFIRDRIHRRAMFMYGTEYDYLTDNGACGFIKYYKGGKYAYAALLPDEGISVDEYLNTLDGTRLHKILSNPLRTEVRTSMPKLNLDYCVPMDEILRSMGIERAFDPGSAQFGLIGKSSIGNLYIGSVLQKAHIEIDEEGTKAAAATLVDVACEESAPHEFKVVHLNRPYIYMLFDTETCAPFFIGVMRNPDSDTI